MEETNKLSKINFINPQYDQGENLSHFSLDNIYSFLLFTAI